jgi:hypothetical protein
LTTPAARAAADQLSQELPGLRTTASVLIGQGNTLANVTNWEGPKADTFRSLVWPDVEAALAKIQTDLGELAAAVVEINRRTAEAGT